SLQPAARADFDTFITLSIASLLGTVVALVVTGLIRVVSAEWSSWRLFRAGWNELADLADGSNPRSTTAWASRMFDRVGLLLPRLARVTDDQRTRSANALRDLQVGVAVVELREVGRAVGAGVDGAIEAALRSLARHARDQARRGHA